MRAVILAAGQGKRLRPLTNDRPKCLVELEGRPLLEHQLEVLRRAGITDISVVGGYLAHELERYDVRLFLNPRYDTTNMVVTLFAAEPIFTEGSDLVITYGDIVYESRVLEALLASDAPVAITVDRMWRRYWEKRMEDPLADAETLRLDGNRIEQLGETPESYDDVEGQYIGLIKVRADHVPKLCEVWRAMDPSGTYRGKDLDNIYMTTFLQHLIDTGWDVRAVPVDNGWLEIDEAGDLSMASHGFWKPLSSSASGDGVSNGGLR